MNRFTLILNTSLLCLGTWTACGQTAPAPVSPGETKPSPAAKLINLSTLNALSNTGQRVSVEAYVSGWQYQSPQLTLKLVAREGVATATVHVEKSANLPTNLHGAKLRLTGINTGSPFPGSAMQVASLDHIEVLEPGTADLFEAPLVSIPTVNARKIEAGKRVRVRGDFAAVLQGNRYVVVSEGQALVALTNEPRSHDAPGMIYGEPASRPVPVPGDTVEIVGSITESRTASAHTFGLSSAFARIVGKGSIPIPERVAIETLLSYRKGDRWVTTEGVVGGWSLQGTIFYYLLNDASSSITLSVRNVPAVFPKDLWGARIRFTGIACSLVTNYQGIDFFVPDNSFVEVLARGKEDQFDGPEYSAADILARRVPPAELVKARGVLIGRSDRVLYLRAQDASLCVCLKSPWMRPPIPTVFAEGVPPPPLKIGDEIEVAGHSIHAEANPHYAPFDLVNAQVRVIGHQESVEPVSTTFARVAAGEHTSDLVQVRGRLLTYQHAPLPGGQWRTTLLLKSNEQKLVAVHQGGVFHPFDTLKPDDDVLLQGVVDRATAQTPRQLWLLSPSGAKSLGVSSEVITRRFWLWGMGALSVFALFSGWIVALRRSVRTKSEVATLLDQKVNERTTELRQAQTDLSKALEHERELSELKSRFVSIVSHEFRTPLGVTMSAVEIMRQFDERLSYEKRRELCDEIYSSTCNMADLMEQVLLLGRVEAGKLGFNPVPLNLDGLVPKLIDELLSATNRKCPILWQPQTDLNGAQGDEAFIRHILGNLAGNAVKYSPEASAVIIQARRDGMDVVFEVTDHGIGILEKDLPHLYEAFHRGGNVSNVPGTGLGLVIVKRCVELHRGLVTVKSEVNRGTTFTVRLPVFAASTPTS